MDSYDHAVYTMDKEKRKKYWEEAEEYNAMLVRENPQLSDAFSQEAKKSDSAYSHVLDMEDSGIVLMAGLLFLGRLPGSFLCEIDIPTVQCRQCRIS